MQAVILAAGKGLRLRPFTENHPKPLIKISDKPLLQYTLEGLPSDITEIIIVVGYLGDQIKDQFGNTWQNKPITYVEQTDLLGTGDAILRAKPLLKNRFLVINGDDLYSPKDLSRMLENGLAMLAWDSHQAYEFGLNVSEDNKFLGFNVDSKITNCGVYLLDCSFFDYELATVEVNNQKEYSLPHTLAKMALDKDIAITKATHWLPVGTPEQLEFARNYYIAKLK